METGDRILLFGSGLTVKLRWLCLSLPQPSSPQCNFNCLYRDPSQPPESCSQENVPWRDLAGARTKANQMWAHVLTAESSFIQLQSLQWGWN